MPTPKKRKSRRHGKTRATNPGDRTYKFPEYARWRRAVRKRDGNKCQMCGDTKKIKTHHIRRWADAPGLRFVVSNGICLCRKCHDRITGSEQAYQSMFARIVLRNSMKMSESENPPLSAGDAGGRESDAP